MKITSYCLQTELHSKTWAGLSAGTVAHSADPDQMLQNEVFD